MNSVYCRFTKLHKIQTNCTCSQKGKFILLLFIFTTVFRQTGVFSDQRLEFRPSPIPDVPTPFFIIDSVYCAKR